jgi:hypothetical protein
MIIELTDRYDHKKTLCVNSDRIITIDTDNNNNTTVFLTDDTYENVKETPAQIQEMIMLDEFAKEMLPFAVKNQMKKGNDNMYTTAYRMAKEMIKAKREASK